jgi:hypothetical protein
MSTENDQVTAASRQVNNLINLVMEGESSDDLIDATVADIHEGYGNGPFPIGSKVRINTSWAGEAVGGKSAALKQGDVVSVLQSGLGEQGQDRIVLFSDGVTKAEVPLSILGECIVEEDPLKVGPKGHEVPAAAGKLGGQIKGKSVGDAPTPEKSQPAKPAKGKLSSIPSTFVGKGKPKDDPAAQPTPAVTATGAISGKKLEDLEVAVLEALEKALDEADSATLYKAISMLQRRLVKEGTIDIYDAIHEMMTSEHRHTYADLSEVFEGKLPPWLDKKKKKGDKDNGGKENGDKDNGDNGDKE